MKKNQKYKIVLAVAITAFVTFALTLFGYYYYLERSGALLKNYKENADLAKSLDVVRTYIDQYYKGEIDENKLTEAAIRGYMDGLGDKYTKFMSNDEWNELETSLSDYNGIGAYISELKEEGEPVIIGMVSENCPAVKVGLKSGDIILEVDGEKVTGKDVEYVTSKVKGDDGTTVKLKIKRDNEEIEFDIVREKIKLYEISYKMLENNIGYVDFDSFTEDSFNEFKNAYEELKKQGAEKLIIDLRDNTGGYVTSALNIADLMVVKGKTLLITEDHNNQKKRVNAEENKEIDMPIVVLVNKNTASASEILTGILKDYKIATVIGTKTYGKGVIQSIIPNVLGGTLKITSSEYFTPLENKINEIGIEPDIVIEQDSNNEEDIQLNKAIEVLKN